MAFSETRNRPDTAEFPKPKESDDSADSLSETRSALSALRFEIGSAAVESGNSLEYSIEDGMLSVKGVPTESEFVLETRFWTVVTTVASAVDISNGGLVRVNCPDGRCFEAYVEPGSFEVRFMRLTGAPEVSGDADVPPEPPSSDS